jgi:hypothetical protein
MTAPSVALLDMLEDALTPKLDGTRHHRRCLNRTMNASPTPCSDQCVKANEMIRRRRAEAPRQLRLEAV